MLDLAFLADGVLILHLGVVIFVVGGLPVHGASFIQHWLERLIYFEAPLWAFAVLYTAFGLLIVWAWWRFPPR